MTLLARRVALHLVWFAWYALAALLALRFVLKLFGAGPSALTEVVYALSVPVLAPVFVLFGAPREGASVLEWNTLLGIALYWALAWVIARFAIIGSAAAEEEGILDEEESA